MSSFLKVILVLVIGSLLIVNFVPSSSADTADAPVWNDGVVWAYGDKVYMDPVANDIIDMLESNFDATSGASLEKAYMNGSIEVYTFCEVASVTQDEYVLDVYFAAGFDAVADIRIKLQMPAEGTYDLLELADAPMEEVTMTVLANIEFTAFEKAVLTFEKDTLALKSISSTTSIKADVSFEARNILNMSYEETSVVVERDNMDMAFFMDIEVDTLFSFDPYLDIFDFPLAVGEEWTVQSTVTGTGNAKGSVYASGLPSDALEGFIEVGEGQPMLPSDISTFTGRIGDLELVNGQLESTTEEIYADLRCNAMLEIEDKVHGPLSVYQIYVMGDFGPESVFYYSPELSMLNSVELMEGALPTDDIPGIDELPITFEPQEDLKFGSMEPKVAAQGIYDLTGEVVSDDVDTGKESGGLDLGIFMVAAVAGLVIVILAFVLINRKK